MNKYMFRTTATMKEYNRAHWYIDPDIIRTKYISADSLREALHAYAEEVTENEYITITPHALRTKSPMYIDTAAGDALQVGYVITASTEMQRDNGTWTTQYIDLWISIDQLQAINFEEAC